VHLHALRDESIRTDDRARGEFQREGMVPVAGQVDAHIAVARSTIDDDPCADNRSQAGREIEVFDAARVVVSGVVADEGRWCSRRQDAVRPCIARPGEGRGSGDQRCLARLPAKGTGQPLVATEAIRKIAVFRARVGGMTLAVRSFYLNDETIGHALRSGYGIQVSN